MHTENELWPQDKALFENMAKSYTSRNEQLFFETLREKMECENAPWEEVLVSSFDNYDQLSFMRLTYDEFFLSKGCSHDEWLQKAIHTMSLSEVLDINLKEAGLLNRDITLLKWLREQDFCCVRYDHSNDSND